MFSLVDKQTEPDFYCIILQLRYPVDLDILMAPLVIFPTSLHAVVRIIFELNNHHGALGRRKIERGPLWTCRVHRRQLHRGYPIFLPYPRAMVGGLSHFYTSTFLNFTSPTRTKTRQKGLQNSCFPMLSML